MKRQRLERERWMVLVEKAMIRKREHMSGHKKKFPQFHWDHCYDIGLSVLESVERALSGKVFNDRYWK